MCADRYHDRVLRTSREVRNVLACVTSAQPIAPYTIAPCFDGFRERFTIHNLDVTIRPFADPHTSGGKGVTPPRPRECTG